MATLLRMLFSCRNTLLVSPINWLSWIVDQSDLAEPGRRFQLTEQIELTGQAPNSKTAAESLSTLSENYRH